MTIKTTLQGGLIYLTFSLFALTAALLRTRWQQVGRILWFFSFCAAVASVAWRGFHTGHPPMQNLFEFFLCMAAALWPLSIISRWRTGIDTDFQDALLGLVILFPAGFIFSEDIRRLPPALQSPLFVPHVASYVASYILLARAAVLALPLFAKGITEQRGRLLQIETGTRQNAAAGFILLTIGLLLGSIWGKVCWGNYWQWDPKEMWSLATWFIYGAYFHYRLKSGLRQPRMLAALLWLGLLFVVLTLTWINLSRLFTGMHSYAFAS